MIKIAAKNGFIRLFFEYITELKPYRVTIEQIQY